MTAQPQTRLTKAFIHPGFPSSRFAPVWANSRQIRSCLSQPKVAKLGIEVVVHDDLPSAAKQRCKPLAHPSSPHSCSSGRGEQRAATCCEESSPEISRGQNFRKATYISHLPHHHQNCTFGRIPPRDTMLHGILVLAVLRHFVSRIAAQQELLHKGASILSNPSQRKRSRAAPSET